MNKLFPINVPILRVRALLIPQEWEIGLQALLLFPSIPQMLPSHSNYQNLRTPKSPSPVQHDEDRAPVSAITKHIADNTRILQHGPLRSAEQGMGFWLDLFASPCIWISVIY
jgi:hypothetical protein